MGEYSDLIQQAPNYAAAEASARVNDNPDQAAKALDLSNATGAPADHINKNFPAFSETYKQLLTADLVRENVHLQNYINSNPLHASISADDHHNLDSYTGSWDSYRKAFLDFTQPLDDISKNFLDAVTAARAPGYRIVNATGEGIQQGWEGGQIEGWRESPYLTTQALGGVSELAMRTLGAGLGGATRGIGTSAGEAYRPTTAVADWIVKQVGLQDQRVAFDSPLGRYDFTLGRLAQSQPQFTREMTGVAEYELSMGQLTGVVNPSHWIEAGRIPPKGIDRITDARMAELNKAAVEGLQKVLDQATTTNTRPRSPEAFGNLNREMNVKGTISINADRIAELYGDRVPHANDGMFGWVEGIEEKLRAAKEDGVDLRVPIADWLARIDPALAKDLSPDIRAFPEGITAREATEVREPPISVGSPLADVRAHFNTEPLFSIGDRPIRIERVDNSIGAAKISAALRGAEWEELSPEAQAATIAYAKKNNLYGVDQGFHDFELRDQSNNTIGRLNIWTVDGKTIHIDGVETNSGAHSLGPSTVRALFRQIKEQFPEAETVTGQRISGARAQAGIEAFKDDHRSGPVVHFSMDDSVSVVKSTKDFHEILKEAEIQSHMNTPEGRGSIEPTPTPPNIFKENITGNTTQILDLIREKLNSADPRESYLAKLMSVVRPMIEHFIKDMQVKILTEADYKQLILDRNLEATIDSRGIYFPNEHAVYIRDNHDIGQMVHTTLHEAVHGALVKAVEAQPILKRKVELLLAESRLQSVESELYGFKNVHEFIAEALSNKSFQEHLAGIKIRDDLVARLGLTGRTISNLWEAFKSLMHDTFGAKVEGTSVLDAFIQLGPDFDFAMRDQFPGAKQDFLAKYNTMSKADIARMREQVQASLDSMHARSIGLDKKSYEKLKKSMLDRNEEDFIKALARAEKEQKREQTVQWKKDYEDTRAKVTVDINQRPDVAVDLLLGSGEFQGRKLDKKYRIARDTLTEEQQALVPDHYLGKEGLDAEHLANMFGYRTADEMVAAMSEYKKAKGDLHPREFSRKLIKEETDRRMRKQFGDLEENIMDAARDQALSDVNVDHIGQEYLAMGLKHGVATVDIKLVKAEMKEKVWSSPLDTWTKQDLDRTIAKAGSDAEQAFASGDPTAAVQALQVKYSTVALANEHAKLVTQMEKFDKFIKRYSKREMDNMDLEALDAIHDIAGRLGKKINRTRADLEREMAARPDTVNTTEKIIDKLTGPQYGYLIPVDFAKILDPTWSKDFMKLTGEEFDAIDRTLRGLAHAGRNESKVTMAGDVITFSTIKQAMIESLEKLYGMKTTDRPDGLIGNQAERLARSYLIKHIKMETMLNAWDEYDPFGAWNQSFMKGLIDGTNYHEKMRREVAKKIQQFYGRRDFQKEVENDVFFNPDTGVKMKMTREGLISVMLNMGTKLSFVKLAKGYEKNNPGLTTQMIQDWVNKHATKEDWAVVEKIWNEVFAPIKEESDTMYRSLGGAAPKFVEGRMIQTPFGQIEGKYYPIMYNPEFERTYRAGTKMDALELHYNKSAFTADGYTKDRTGYVAPINLDLSMMPGRIDEVLKDIALRPALINARKIMRNADIRSTIKNHAGQQWLNEMETYLMDVAGNTGRIDPERSRLKSALEFLRSNLITNLVGLNINTVLKHGPTALVQSVHEVGLGDFMRQAANLWRRDLQTGETNLDFAFRNSEELQRRRGRGYADTLTGATNDLVSTNKYMKFRAGVMEFAGTPVSMSDLASAVPTWLATYRKSVSEGLSHGDSVYMADRSVRRAHGSTAITDKPGALRTQGLFTPWLTSVYNFFNHIMNRQLEMVWQARETIADTKYDGLTKEVRERWADHTNQMFAYVVAPALIESWVSKRKDQENESWPMWILLSTVQVLSSGLLGFRDIASAVIEQKDPVIGLSGTAAQSIGNLIRDGRKSDPLSREKAGKLLQDGAFAVGTFAGAPGTVIGRGLRYGHDVATGVERPKNWDDIQHGIRFGHTK
jgi:uncharacterized protein YeaO (DUF488 family)